MTFKSPITMFFTINGSKFMYGHFFNALIAFVIQAAVVYFFVVLPINKMMSKMGMDKKTPATVVYEALSSESSCVRLMLQPNKI